MQLPNNFKWYIASAVALVIIGMAGLNLSLGKQIDMNAESMAVMSGKILETDSQRLRAINAKDEATAWAVAANERVKLLEARLARTRIPPKPAPAPETLPELQTVLVKYGLGEGLSIVETQPSTLGRPDALKVYEWASQAARVAPLEDRVSAQGELIDGLKGQVVTEQVRADKTNEALTVTTKQLVLTQEQAGLLAKRVTLVERKSKTEKFLWGVAGLGAGYLTGRALK